MLFNSQIFAWFFLIVYTAYLLLARRHRAQNLLLLIASVIFYGYWDWRFLSLLFLSTVIDFYASNGIARTLDPIVRKRYLVFSVVSNLTLLGVFKYFNFFSENAARMLEAFGLRPDVMTMQVVLPVGISFYTFQTMSYTIDVYRGRLQPARDLLDFSLFVSFFPQLVAGPIERAGSLLPQMVSPRRIRIEHVHAGLFLLLWGYFKKVVVADNVGSIANEVFNHYTQYRGADLAIGIVAFAVQIYGDFSGYSDIARGLAKLMGFELMVNFKLPYFAVSPQDFWARWHVSLSTWLRDYLYVPLGGNRCGAGRTCLNLMLTMLLGGLWHGAAWNFVAWGAYHGALLVGYRAWYSGRDGTMASGGCDRWWRGAQMGLMGMWTLIGWVLFRSSSMEQIMYMLSHVGFSLSPESLKFGYTLLFFAVPLLAAERYQHVTGDLLVFTKWRWWLRAAFYGALVVWILVFGVRESMEFIYFQF